LAERVTQTVGRGAGSALGIWHTVRRPYDNEGTPEKRATDWRLSLCALVWEITEFRASKPTCWHCLNRAVPSKRSSVLTRNQGRTAHDQEPSAHAGD